MGGDDFSGRAKVGSSRACHLTKPCQVLIIHQDNSARFWIAAAQGAGAKYEPRQALTAPEFLTGNANFRSAFSVIEFAAIRGIRVKFF
jgi:hypothetical protein